MAFSYAHHDSSFSLTADNLFLPKIPTHMPLLPQQVGEMMANSPFFYNFSPNEVSAAETGAFDSSCSLGNTGTGVHTPSVSSHGGLTSAFMAKNIEISTGQHENSFDRSKTEAQTRFTDKQLKDAKQINKSKKQKRSSTSGDVEQKDEKKLKNDESKACKEDAPTGYIHVRARRGQATDSHSLAERVRREKISERMKMLQELVPGCDKVTGKAHMLDEIINYVQSLQNQVEFLSMKLASFSPILYDFGVELDECMNQPDHQKIYSMMPQTVAAESSNHLNPRVVESEATNGYQMVDHPAPVLLQGQGSMATFSQDVGSFVVQVAAQRQGNLNQLGFINMCTFQ